MKQRSIMAELDALKRPQTVKLVRRLLSASNCFKLGQAVERELGQPIVAAIQELQLFQPENIQFRQRVVVAVEQDDSPGRCRVFVTCAPGSVERSCHGPRCDFSFRSVRLSFFQGLNRGSQRLTDAEYSAHSSPNWRRNQCSSSKITRR